MLDGRWHLAALISVVVVHSQAQQYGTDQHRRGGFRHGCPVLTLLRPAVMALAVMMLADQPVLLTRVTGLPVRLLLRHLLWRPVLLAVFAKYRLVLASARHVLDG